MREIKFKVVWNNNVSTEAYTIGGFIEGVELEFKDGSTLPMNDIDWGKDKVKYIQFTGLKDKNGLIELYEGDIIDENGNKKGNIYENHKEETDLVIQGFGTSAWEATNKKALARGCKYSE